MLPRLWRTFSSFSSVVLICSVVLYLSPLVPAVANWLTGDWQDPKGDILIVLGGSALEDGIPGYDSYWRSVYAARDYAAGGFQLVLISGGPVAGSNGRPVAQSMANMLVELGVPRERILEEQRSRSTRENALFTIPLLRGKSGTKVLLTSDIHMRRAHAAFLKAGLETVPSPVPDFRKRWNDWPSRWNCICDVAVALAKYGYYSLKRWI